MNQYKAIYQIREMLQNLITEYADSDSQLTQKLKTIDQELQTRKAMYSMSILRIHATPASPLIGYSTTMYMI